MKKNNKNFKTFIMTNTTHDMGGGTPYTIKMLILKTLITITPLLLLLLKFHPYKTAPREYYETKS